MATAMPTMSLRSRLGDADMPSPYTTSTRSSRRSRRRLISAGAIVTLALLVGVGRPDVSPPVEATALTTSLGLRVPDGARMLARSFDSTTGETMLVVDLSGDTPVDWTDLRILWRRPPLAGVILAKPTGPMPLPSRMASDAAWRGIVADHRVRADVHAVPPTSE